MHLKMKQLTTTVCTIIQLFILVYARCPSSSIVDVTAFSRQLWDMKEILQGHTDVDLWFPKYKGASPIGQMQIALACDLECYDFDALLTKPCRWHYESVPCSGLDFIRMKGSWNLKEGGQLFGKNDGPDGYFLLAGVDHTLPSDTSILLVSDPIQCQSGDGHVTFKHWTSPAVQLRVCIRKPSVGSRFDWCSDIVKRNGTELANVTIPGSVMYTFEIVLQTSNFVFDLFGKKGGMVAVDDLSYNASAIYNCQMIPHYEPPVPLNTKACVAVQCNFQYGTCISKLKETGWEMSKKPTGPRLTGIREILEGRFGYVRGPGTYSFELGKFTLSRPFILEFCFYSAAVRNRLMIFTEPQSTQNRTAIFESPPITMHSRQWICERVLLSNDTYNYLEFSAQRLRNEFSYLAVDQIGLVDPLTMKNACEK